MAQKLMTAALLKKLPAPNSMNHLPLDKRDVVVKFFTPWADWSWYALEGRRQPDGDLRFFGYISNSYGAEFGYFMLSSLEELRRRGVLVERDKMFRGNLADLMEDYRRKGAIHEMQI